MNFFRLPKVNLFHSVPVFTNSAPSPVHAVSPEQFAAAEQRHEQEKVVVKQVKEKGVVKDTEALRVSMDQLREVIYASSREVEDL